ncbi:MAG: hypothetical protein Kow0069_21200 [Promethearchaeota archaeon]
MVEVAQTPPRVVVVYPEAFLKVLLHAYRFEAHVTEKRSRVFGLLLGREDGHETLVVDAEPVGHESGDSNADFGEILLQHAKDINRSNAEASLTDRVKGYYVTHHQLGLKLSAAEIKALIPLQEGDPKCVAVVIDSTRLDQTRCFSAFSLQLGAGGFYSAMSDYDELQWRMEEFDNTDRLLAFFHQVVVNVSRRKPLVTEIDEY